MKKFILSLTAAAILMAGCHSNAKSANGSDSSNTASAVDTANLPKMKFDHDMHDFGKINTGDKVSYNFSFTNTGKMPLIIADAVASCGCTTPVWPKTPIAPGAGGQISVMFNSAGKKGLQDKMITITANTLPRQNVVHLIGEVVEK